MKDCEICEIRCKPLKKCYVKIDYSQKLEEIFDFTKDEFGNLLGIVTCVANEIGAIDTFYHRSPGSLEPIEPGVYCQGNETLNKLIKEKLK